MPVSRPSLSQYELVLFSGNKIILIAMAEWHGQEGRRPSQTVMSLETKAIPARLLPTVAPLQVDSHSIATPDRGSDHLIGIQP